MSLKKISAIAVGGAMVASTLASGVAAAYFAGHYVDVNDEEVKEFMEKIIVDGKPNVEIVVGSKAAAMDVVSAADIAAKIGSMCYREEVKDVVVEDGSAELSIRVSADTVLSNNLNDVYDPNERFLIFTTPKRSYTIELGRSGVIGGLVEHEADVDPRTENITYDNNLVYVNITNISSGTLTNGNIRGTVDLSNVDIISASAINLTQGWSVTQVNSTNNWIEYNVTNVTNSSQSTRINITINSASGTLGLNGAFNDGNITQLDADQITVVYRTSSPEVQTLARLNTLIRDTDADPNDISNNDDADAIEFLLASVLKERDDRYHITGADLVYGSLMFTDGGKRANETESLFIGMEIPFLGEIYRVVDTDGNIIYLGKEAYTGNIKEGESIDIGNGYQVRVKSVLQPVDNTGSDPQVTIEILKNGKLVKTKSGEVPFEFVYKDIGVIVYGTYKDISEEHGFASVIITKDVKGYELGSEFVKDWRIYAIIRDGNSLEDYKEDIKERELNNSKFLVTDDNNERDIVGLMLRYEGDSIENLENGDKVDFVNDYATLEFTDDDEDGALYARFKMDLTKDVSLDLMEKVEMLNAEFRLKDLKAIAYTEEKIIEPVKTPIARLDTEVSLDTNKYLILVGGPVANKLSEELQRRGKIDIDNYSPATIQVVDDRILVVAGGDRYKTRIAALYLVEKF